MLKTISLGNHFFEIGILFRNLVFVNSVLINAEVWYPIKDDDIEELEIMDRKLLRKILDVPDGTPNELLYLETGCIPLKDIIKCRRINYLHDILTRNEDELISRFFKAQLRNPSRGDWCEIVKKDLIDFEFTESLEEFSKLTHNKLQIADYLVSNVLTTRESKMLFKIRSRMLDVKENFKHKCA